MAFPKTIRDQALVDSARHCCVCHRYCGVGIEAHHIIQESDGGGNDASNAIALCFDCHAAAGHYNPRHPKGTKFSPEELRKHRNSWHAIVQQNQTPNPNHEDLLYCRYIVCRDPDIVKETILGELENFPAEKPHLIENEVLRFGRQMIATRPKRLTRHPEYGREYESLEHYMTINGADPSVKLTSADYLPYFEASRIPTADEAKEYLGRADSVSAFLLDQDLSTENFCRALVYDQGCGGSELFQEVLVRRGIWIVMMAATNISAGPISLNCIHLFNQNPEGLGFRGYPSVVENSNSFIYLPKAAIPPEATVVFPTAIVLAPFDPPSFSEWSVDSKKLEPWHWQDLSYGSFLSKSKGFSLIGPAWFPSNFLLEAKGVQEHQPVHELDLQNVYVIDKHFAVGSCPFLLFRVGWVGSPSFAGHLFSDRPGQTLTETIVIPRDVRGLILAELEDEVTFIETASINGELVEVPSELQKGSFFELSVMPGDTVTICGGYQPVSSAIQGREDPMKKNELLSRFLERLA